MSYTDQELLADIQRLMIEPTVDSGLTWASGLWTLSEVLTYANERQQRFLAETCLTGGWYQLAAPAQEVQTLDDEVVYVKHAVWENADPPPGTCHPLVKISRWSADLAMPGWPGNVTNQTVSPPVGYAFEQTATRSLSLIPPPTAGGTLHLFAVVLAATLDRNGVELEVPDEWMPTIRFGIMANMLSKLYDDAADKVRADYCRERWQEGIDSAKAVLQALL